MKSKKIIIAVAASCLFATSFVKAEEESSMSNNLVIYLWGAAQKGDSGVRDISGPLGNDRDVISELDMSFSDIWDNLDAGAMVYYESTINDKWGMYVDFIYMKISDDADVQAAGVNVLDIEAEAAETILELGAAYKIKPDNTFDVIGGIRYADVDVDIELAGQGPAGANRDFNVGDDWIDPFVGVRSRQKLSENWELLIRADIGGFGVASDSTWGALVGGSYNFNKQSSLKMVYRVLDYDYDDNDFVFDVETTGFGLGYGYRF